MTTSSLLRPPHKSYTHKHKSCEFTFSKLDLEIYMHNDYMKYVKETSSLITYSTELEQELFYCKEWLRINPTILRESSKMRKRAREIIHYAKPLLESLRIKFNDIVKVHKVLLDEYYLRNDGDESYLNDIECSRNNASELIKLTEYQLKTVNRILGHN